MNLYLTLRNVLQDEMMQPMIILQGLPDPPHCFSDEIELQTAEEIVDDGCSFGSDFGDHIPGIPDPPELGPEVFSSEYGSSTRHGKGKGKKSAKSVKHQLGEGLSLQSFDASGPHRWERKQVQIKTLDGEFSVTMWASGKFTF